MQAFLNDEAPDAFARLVDRLLENPHYGERWARHWLDIARYGDTKGYLAGSQETRYPYAFTYRDYVIDAFNNDKPFDQFVIEQLAADQLELAGAQRSVLAAMGFLTVGRRFMNQPHDIIDDRIDVVTRGFLGMSVASRDVAITNTIPSRRPTITRSTVYSPARKNPRNFRCWAIPKRHPSTTRSCKRRRRNNRRSTSGSRSVAWQPRTNSAFASPTTWSTLPRIYRSTDKAKRNHRVNVGRCEGPPRGDGSSTWRIPRSHLFPIWTLWHRLTAMPANEFAEQAATIFEEAANSSLPVESTSPESNAGPADTTAGNPTLTGISRKLLDALRKARPQSMPEAAQVFGDCLEAAHAQWAEAQSERKP